jgi:hypothetical protein
MLTKPIPIAVLASVVVSMAMVAAAPQEKPSGADPILADPVYAGCLPVATEEVQAKYELGEDKKQFASMSAHYLCEMLAGTCRDQPSSDKCKEVLHKYSIKAGGSEPSTLYNAAYAGRVEVARTMLAIGFDPNAPEPAPSWSPLMIAAAEGHDETVAVLLEGGANTNATNDVGRTALMFASTKGHTAIVRDLLEHGADPNIVPKDETGWTALIAAAYNGHRDVVKILLGKGADKTIRDKEGQTAHTRADAQGHHKVARLLED